MEKENIRKTEKMKKADKSLWKRKFVAYWFFVGLEQISFGISIDFFSPNIELHLPFGFFRFGFQCVPILQKIR